MVLAMIPTAIREDLKLHGSGHLRQLQLELSQDTVPNSLIKGPS